MRLLLYGGTFDPPHNGHLNNLCAAAACVQPDKVIIMPAGVPPHKHASATPGKLRLEMCKCFYELAGHNADIPDIEVSSWEIEQAERGFRNYTVLTLEMLADKFPDYELYLAMGSDMLLSFNEWYRWQDILKLAKLVVTSREVGDMPALHACAQRLCAGDDRIFFAHVEALPMASSQLRARLAAGDGCADALPESVRNIIKREKLYVPRDIKRGNSNGR